jgi:hypothetical protein
MTFSRRQGQDVPALTMDIDKPEKVQNQWKKVKSDI